MAFPSPPVPMSDGSGAKNTGVKVALLGLRIPSGKLQEFGQKAPAFTRGMNGCCAHAQATTILPALPGRPAGARRDPEDSRTHCASPTTSCWGVPRSSVPVGQSTPVLYPTLDGCAAREPGCSFQRRHAPGAAANPIVQWGRAGPAEAAEAAEAHVMGWPWACSEHLPHSSGRVSKYYLDLAFLISPFPYRLLSRTTERSVDDVRSRFPSCTNLMIAPAIVAAFATPCARCARCVRSVVSQSMQRIVINSRRVVRSRIADEQQACGAERLCRQNSKCFFNHDLG